MAGRLEGTPVVVIDASDVEKAVFAAMAPRSGDEYTSAGINGLAVLNVLNDTQNECPSAAVAPLVAFSEASDEVMPDAALVVTLAAAIADVPIDRSPNIAAMDRTPIDTCVNRLNNFFKNFIIYYSEYLILI